MAFRKVNVDNEIEKRCMESPEFRKEWEENYTEYKLIGEMISLRKQRRKQDNNL